MTDTENVVGWRRCWRDGFARVLPTAGLVALREALVKNSPELIQGSTSLPPPLSTVMDWPVEGACVVGYCGWQGEGLETVAKIHEFFCGACFDADQMLGEPGGCRWFLNRVDDTPREEMVGQLLPEVERELNRRGIHV